MSVFNFQKKREADGDDDGVEGKRRSPLKHPLFAFDLVLNVLRVFTRKSLQELITFETLNVTCPLNECSFLLLTQAGCSDKYHVVLVLRHKSYSYGRLPRFSPQNSRASDTHGWVPSVCLSFSVNYSLWIIVYDSFSLASHSSSSFQLALVLLLLISHSSVHLHLSLSLFACVFLTKHPLLSRLRFISRVISWCRSAVRSYVTEHTSIHQRGVHGELMNLFFFFPPATASHLPSASTFVLLWGERRGKVVGERERTGQNNWKNFHVWSLPSDWPRGKRVTCNDLLGKWVPLYFGLTNCLDTSAE